MPRIKGKGIEGLPPFKELDVGREWLGINCKRSKHYQENDFVVRAIAFAENRKYIEVLFWLLKHYPVAVLAPYIPVYRERNHINPHTIAHRKALKKLGWKHYGHRCEISSSALPRKLTIVEQMVGNLAVIKDNVYYDVYDTRKYGTAGFFVKK